MFLRFLKNWTLPVSMTTGALLYLCFASIPSLDDFSAKADKVITAVFPFVMMTILFATFCKVDYKRLKVSRWHLSLMTCHLLLIVFFILLSHLPLLSSDSIIIHQALMVCIVAPCAAAAPVVTGKIGGSIESMTSYTLLSNIVSACIIPIVFTIIPNEPEMVNGQASVIPSTQSILQSLLRSTALILLLPMAMAWLVKHYTPHFHRAVTSVRDLPFYLWAISLSIVSGLTMKHILHAKASLSLLIILAAGSLFVCLLQFYLGRKLGKRHNAEIESGQGFGQKNTAFAIWLAITHLTPVSSVAPGCYILWQNIINSIEISAHRKKGLGSLERTLKH